MNPNPIPERPAVRKLRLFLESVGEARGEARGRAEGLADAKREDLRMILAERGLPLTEDERERIEKCSDVDQLTTWLRRAITAGSTAEVFESAPRAVRPRRSRLRTA